MELFGSLSNWFFLWVTAARMNVSEDVDLCASDFDAFEGMDSAMVCMPGERIWLAHRLARLVVQEEVELGKVQQPPSLFPVELLGRHEVLQVLVICPNLELVISLFDKVAPLL